MTRIARVLVGLLVAVLVLGAGGGGDGNADNARAERIVLRKGDLPSGWRAQPDDDDEATAQFDPDDLSDCEFVGPSDYSDLEPTGSSESPSFESGDEFQFASGTAPVFAEVANAREIFDAFAGGCLTELLGGSPEHAEPTGDSEVGPVDVEPLEAPQVGDEAEAGRVTTEIRFSEGGSLDLTFDIVMIRDRRALAFLLTGGLGDRFPTAESERIGRAHRRPDALTVRVRGGHGAGRAWGRSTGKTPWVMKRLAVVLAVALVAACADASGGEGSGRSVTATGQSGRPKQIAAIVDEKVVVLSSKNGKVVRTLVEGPDAAGASSVAVSADGELVYFTRDDPVALCGEGHATQIVTVPIDGGQVQIYASGREPVPSPDGAWIAYMTGGPDQCAVPSLLAIEALGTEEFSQQLIPLQGEGRRPWAWSPDSELLLFEDGGTFTTDPTAESAPEALPVMGNPLVDAAYLGSSSEVALGEHVDTNLAQVAVQNLETGKTRRLFRISDFAMSGFSVDTSGRHLVLWGASDQGQRPTLYRWSRGEKPREIAAGMASRDAAWVPRASGA